MSATPTGGAETSCKSSSSRPTSRRPAADGRRTPAPSADGAGRVASYWRIGAGATTVSTSPVATS